MNKYVTMCIFTNKDICTHVYLYTNMYRYTYAHTASANKEHTPTRTQPNQKRKHH